jgi:predicted nucleic acid-binding protein
MGTLNLAGLPDPALLLIDSPPIIYFLEDRPGFGDRFEPLFDAHADGRARLAVTPVTIAEVLTGPFKAGDEALARRYRAMLESWELVTFSVDVAESAARLRATLGLKLADAIQVASALAIGADALVSYDRDFSRVRSLRIIS